MTPTHQSHPLVLHVPPLVILAIICAASWFIARAAAQWSFEYMAKPWATASFVVLGFTCSCLGVVSFRRAKTTVNPTNPSATSSLVTCGVYRFSRNPMYLGFLFFILGDIAWLANPLVLFGWPAFVLYMNRFQIAPEESALTKRFGAEYTTYAGRVRRWL